MLSVITLGGGDGSVPNILWSICFRSIAIWISISKVCRK